jgi:hypothetical protein
MIRRSAWTVLVGSMALLAACGGSDSSGSSNSSSTAKATITSFTVPKTTACAPGDTSTSVDVEYAVSGAVRQKLLVDGLAATGVDGSSGTVTVQVHCDPLPHTVVLVAYNSAGERTSKQELLDTTSS